MNRLSTPRYKRIFLTCLLAACLSLPAHAASVFNFDAEPPGQGTPFTSTSGDLSATFSSPGDPGGFGIIPGFFSTLSGNVLIDPGPAGLDHLTLNIAFDTNLRSIGLDFAVNAAAPTPLTLTALKNGATIGTATMTGVFPYPGAQSPEGHIFFTGPSFDSVALTSGAYDFAIDNVAVLSPTPAPEPATAALLGLAAALTGFSAITFRRRKR